MPPMSTSGRSQLNDPAQDQGDANPQTPLIKRSLPKPSNASEKIASLFQDWWMWEIVSATTAALAVVVIVVVLVIFDQSSLPDWPSVFTVRSFHIIYFKF